MSSSLSRSFVKFSFKVAYPTIAGENFHIYGVQLVPQAKPSPKFPLTEKEGRKL